MALRNPGNHPDRLVRAGKVPIPSGSCSKRPGRCDEALMPGPPSHASSGGGPTGTEGFPMAVKRLTCKECGADYPLEARFVCDACFGPLEVTLRLLRARRGVEPSGGSRPARSSIWRYADFLPFEAPPSDGARRGRDAAGAGRPARRAARAARGVGQERRRQPDALVQGPRRDGRAREGARARLRGRRLRVDRQPRERGRRARRRRRARVVRLHPGRPRGAEDPRHRRLRHEPRRRQRQLRRRQPALHRAVGASASGRS